MKFETIVDWVTAGFVGLCIGGAIMAASCDAHRARETRTIVKTVEKRATMLCTGVKFIKVPVETKTVVIDHRTPRSLTRELHSLRHQVWVDKQNIATANLR